MAESCQELPMARIRFENVPYDNAAEKDEGGAAASRRKGADLIDPAGQRRADEQVSGESADPGAHGKKKRMKRAKPA